MGKGRTVPGSLRDREAQDCMRANDDTRGQG